MNVITTLFVHNLCLFVNKAFDIVSIHMKFNAKSKEKATFNFINRITQVL